jgi:hypothetical protein
LGRSGCVYNTPASKGYLKHFKAGGAAYTSFRRRRPPRPLLGRSGCVYNTPASKGYLKHFKAGGAASTSFRRRRPPRPLLGRSAHSGVEGSHIFFLGRSGCVNLIPASKAIKITFKPVGSCPSHFGVEKLPRPLRGRSGRIELIPASNVTHTTFRPVGLTISHFGVKGHPDHFWVGGIASSSFWRGRSPRLLLVRSGKNKKAKKVKAPFGIRTHTSLNAQRFIKLTIQTYDVTPVKLYLT